MRASILEGLAENESLCPTLAFQHALLAPEAYVGMGSGTGLVTAPFACDEGAHQGAVESGWNFALAVNKAFQRFIRTLEVVDGGVVAIIDDNHALGLPRALFATNQVFVQDLAEVGLEAQPAKVQCWIRDEDQTASWHQHRGAIPEGKRTLGDGTIVRGVTVCNISVRSQEYTLDYLSERAGKIEGAMSAIGDLLDPRCWPHHEIPIRQQ
ncbi:hypothetical protein ACHAWF_001937, partial [Thalassiosira exigua]